MTKAIVSRLESWGGAASAAVSSAIHLPLADCWLMPVTPEFRSESTPSRGPHHRRYTHLLRCARRIPEDNSLVGLNCRSARSGPSLLVSRPRQYPRRGRAPFPQCCDRWGEKNPPRTPLFQPRGPPLFPLATPAAAPPPQCVC